jgi:AraC-like DNA-binding protein
MAGLVAGLSILAGHARLPDVPSADSIAGNGQLNVGQIVTELPWHFNRHLHGRHHEMIIVHHGRIRVAMEGRQFVGTAGAVLFYPRGVAHEEWSVGAGRFHTVFFSWDDRDDGIDTSAWPREGVDRSHRVRFLSQWMLELHSRPRSHELDDTLRALLRLTLFEYSQSAVRLGAAQDAVLAATQYMQDHMADDIRLDDLAAAAGLSRFHFARLFQAATGQSPMHYLAQARVASARNLLRLTALPHRQIAEQTGFADEYHFSRVYRRITGRPPGAERE